MSAAIFVAVALAATPLDERLSNGAVYRHLDRELMAKIHAQHVAAREAKRRYDPVTWLPVEEEKPTPRHKSARAGAVEEERRAARMKLAALRKQKRQQASGADPLWQFINSRPFNPRCPWSWVSY